MTKPSPSRLPQTRIQASSRVRLLDIRELWSYRELMYLLTWRNIAVRYKQTVLGAAWVVLQPLALMAAFTVFFGRLAALPSDGVPYPLFAFTALLPWQLFSTSLTSASMSLVTDQQLISRVYFPRVLVPVAAILAALVDFLVASSALVVLLVIYGVTPGLAAIWIPLFLLLLLVTATGVALWFSALNIEYRDVSYMLPFLAQFWLFVTPVVYSTSLVPDDWLWLFALNPMVAVIDGFRWSLLGVGDGPNWTMLPSVGVAGVLLLSGLAWFRYAERTFIDTVGSGGR